MLCLLFNIILYSEVSLLSLPYRGNKSHLAIGQLPSLQSFSKPCQHALLLFLKMQFHCCKSGWPEHHRHSGLCANCFSHDTSEHTYCFCTPWLKKHHLVSLRVLGCWMPCHSRMNVKKKSLFSLCFTTKASVQSLGLGVSYNTSIRPLGTELSTPHCFIQCVWSF